MKNITVLGNCTKDAVMRQAGSNNVASFDVAVNGFAKGGKTTTYFRVSVWGKRGEAVMQFAKKGAKLCISGDFSTDEYNGKTNLNINASEWSPAGGGNGNHDNNQDQQGGYGQSPNQSSGYGAGGQGGGYGGAGDMDDQEIPF